MTKQNWLDELRSDAEGQRLLNRERLLIEATEGLARIMEADGVSRKELAKRLEVTPARITHLLRGTANVTLATLADAYLALGHTVHIDSCQSDGNAHPRVEWTARTSAKWDLHRARDGAKARGTGTPVALNLLAS